MPREAASEGEGGGGRGIFLPPVPVLLAVDVEEKLLVMAFRRLLTMAETDTRRLRRKNRKTLWLNIE